MFGLMLQLDISVLQPVLLKNGKNGGKIQNKFNYINLWVKIIFLSIQ
jgi:hypothetical protein